MPNFTFTKKDGSKVDLEAKDQKEADKLAKSKYGIESKEDKDKK